jgi:hypothetical protein
MDNTHSLLNVAIIAFLIIAILEYGIDMTTPYPKPLLDLFAEPWVRLLLYVMIYIMACYNKLVAVMLAMFVLLLHLDYINLR